MRGLLAAITGMLLVFGFGFRSVGDFPRALADDYDDAGSDGQSGDGSPSMSYKGPGCIKARAYARYAAGAYDHIVELESACEKTAQCNVSTDVNPDPIDIEVPGGETREVLTFRGSPAYVFSATVRCKLE
jgi:hypothetical protein